MGYRLGVDLGTTFTAAATDDGSGAVMVGLGDRALQVPSVVLLQDDGTFLYGEAAERRARTEPERAVREFKRRIGDTVPVLVGGQPFSPQALSARLLAWVVAKTTERQGAPPDEVVLTHPANWGGYKRELFAQVAELADVERAVTCTEPEAAATQYATRASLEPGDRMAVYDLGGGTFDVCVLEKERVGFRILGSPQGIEHLGGMDFDEAVFQHVLRQLADVTDGLDPDDPHVTTGLAALRRECVEAKEALSSDVSATIAVALPTVSTAVRLTRSELEQLVAPALQETLTATRRALRSADTAPTDLAAVVLVGGSSRIPLVSQFINAELGVPTALDTHPKHDIALGAAVYRDAGKAAAPSPSPAPLPAPPLTLSPSGSELDPTDPPDVRRRPGARVSAAIAAVVMAVGVGVWAAATAGDNSEPPGPDEDPTSEPPQLDDKLVAPIGDDELVVTVEGSPRKLYRVMVSNGDYLPLADLGPRDAGIPGISPDRDAVYFPLVDEDRKVELTRVDEDGMTNVLDGSPNLKCQARPSWSAEADEVVLACDNLETPAGKRVYQVPVARDGSTLVAGDARVLEGSPERFDRVQYADEDGVVVSRLAPPGLTYYPLGGGEHEQLTDELDHHPAVLRESGEIVFERDGDLYALSLTGEFSRCGEGWMLEGLDGVPVCQLTDTEAFETRPAWSPDGRRLAYLSSDSEGGEAELQVRNVDDDPTETGVLIELPGEPVHLCWSSP